MARPTDTPKRERETVALRPNGFEVIAWLDSPLLISRVAAGTTYDVTIAGRSIKLDVPLRGPREIGDERLDDGVRRIPEFPGPPLAEGIVKGGWISIRNSVRPQGGPLILEAIRLRWTDPARRRRIRENLEAGFDFAGELGAWLSIALDWLAAWRHTTQLSVASETTPRMRMAVSGYGGAIGGGRTTTFGVYFPSRQTNKPRELRAAFVAASDGKGLPLERELFAEALAYGEAARWRQAIVAACSAAEVALDREARRLLRRADPNADLDRIMDRTSGLMELYRIASTRNGGLPVSFGRVSGQLAKPRNDAVHAGHPADEDTAKRAIETAEALVNVAPLPSANSILRACN